jgi:hypothetical protein
MNTLPDEGFVTIKQLLGDPQADPPIPPIVPFRKTKLYDEISEGRFPKQIKFGRTSAWRVEDIRAYIANPQ